MRLAVAPARVLKALQMERLLPTRLREALNLLPEQMHSDTTPEFSPSSIQPAKGTVGFVRGCVMSVMFGDTNASSVRLLNHIGYNVVTPRDQVCCGALFAHSGRLKLAREYATKNIAAFERHQFDTIVINAAGCGSTLKEYGHLLENDSCHASGKEFSARVKDLTEFLGANGFANQQFRPSSDLVTYHDACHLAHPQRITLQPRQLVRAVAGANYVELPEADICCGSAGTYNLTQPAMAEALRERKIKSILSTRATVVVTSNPGCIMQIRAGLDQATPKVRVVHIADYLNEALP